MSNGRSTPSVIRKFLGVGFRISRHPCHPPIILKPAFFKGHWPKMAIPPRRKKQVFSKASWHISCGLTPVEIFMSTDMGYAEKIWPKRELSTFTRMVMLVGLYFLGGLLGKQGTFLSGSTVLVWPPAGIALAAILLFGYRFWPGVALGAVLFACING